MCLFSAACRPAVVPTCIFLKFSAKVKNARAYFRSINCLLAWLVINEAQGNFAITFWVERE